MRQGKTSSGQAESHPLPCRFTAKDTVRHRPVPDIIKTIQQEGNCKEIQIMDKLKVIITNDQKAVKIPAGLRLMLRRLLGSGSRYLVCIFQHIHKLSLVRKGVPLSAWHACQPTGCRPEPHRRV